MRRPRPEKGELRTRIDAAMDHLAQYGFRKPQIRNAIHDLLKVYGREGWGFLEEGSYRMVLDKLQEERQAQQAQEQEAAAKEGSSSAQNDIEVSRVHGEAPNDSQSTLEMHASSSNSSPPMENVLPVPPAAKGPPCAEPPKRS